MAELLALPESKAEDCLSDMVILVLVRVVLCIFRPSDPDKWSDQDSQYEYRSESDATYSHRNN